MTSVSQIKAARSLLNWNQDVLASAAGLSKPAIANIERGKTIPRLETMNAITKALTDAGVEFIEGPGVKLRGETLEINIFEGEEAIFRLWQDINETLKEGDERLISGVDETLFDRVAGEDRFRQVMDQFKSRKLKGRILLKHGDTYFVEPKEHYRWVSEEVFSQVPYYIYADKYAILLFEPVPRIVLIENAAIADSYRKQFNALWKNAEIPA